MISVFKFKVLIEVHVIASILEPFKVEDFDEAVRPNLRQILPVLSKSSVF
jgi:hypothetical protein